MSKKEFTDELRIRLVEAGVSPVQDLIDFYDEAINDRIESGMSEEDAVLSVESIDTIVENAKLDMPISTLVKTKIIDSHKKSKESGNGVVWIILAILGFPVWGPLAIAFIAVVFSIFLTFACIIFAIFVTELGIGIGGIGALVGVVFGIYKGVIPFVSVLAGIGSGLILIGLSVLLFKPVSLLAKGLVGAMKVFFKGVKKIFV